MRYSGPPMTLSNMRANGVRTLGVWCSGRGCGHHRVIDVERYGDDVPVPRFGPRLRCERCGHLGADARANGRSARRLVCSAFAGVSGVAFDRDQLRADSVS